jgi:hypothetical protein
MKLFVAPFLFTLFLLSSVASSEVYGQAKTEQEVKTLLCHKWLLTHMEVEGEKVEVDEEMSDSYLVFKKDGSLSEMNGSTTIASRWTYDHKNKTVSTGDEGQEKFKLVKITNTELILQTDVDDMVMNLIMKRIDK